MHPPKSEPNATFTRDDDQELHRLLDAAMDLPPAQLRPFLERTASRPELALEAETLLREEGSHEDFLNPPLPGIVSWTAKTADASSSHRSSSLSSNLGNSPAVRLGLCTSRFSAPGGNEAVTTR